MTKQIYRDRDAAKDFLAEVITEGLRHDFYERTVEVANFAWDVMTGQGDRMEDKIRGIRPNESEEQKDQRLKMTNPLTPFALNQVLSVFRKTRRAEGIRFIYSHEKKDSYPKIDEAIKDFYAHLDLKAWAFDAIEYYTFWDPNAFFVVEVEEGQDGELIPYPFEVRSDEAIYFERKHGDLKYLIVRQEVEVEIDRIRKQRKDFYFYGVGFVLHYKEMLEGQEDEVERLLSQGYIYESNVEAQEGSEKFYFKAFDNGLDVLPVFQFGVFRDGQTKRETFVTPYEPARFLLEDLIQNKSLADLSLYLHNFPQKLVYGPKCEYESQEAERCDFGYLDGDPSKPCPICDGKGVLVHATEQDVILLALPESNEGFFPLSQLIHYATQNEWLPRFQADELEKLVRKIFLAVFQTEVYDQAQVRATATEKLLEWDKVYDTLEPYAAAVASFVPRAAEVIAKYFGAGDGFSAQMYVPKDYKMRGEGELLNLLALTEGKTIPEVKAAISRDLLHRFYRNDPEEIAFIEALRSFLPWKDKTFEQAYAIAASRSPEDPDRLLWENFDQISQDIRVTTKRRFHKFPYKAQEKQIEDAIDRVKARIIPISFTPPVLGPGSEGPEGEEGTEE